MTQENTQTKQRPTHTIYKVTGEGEEAKWAKVGVAFTHKDKKGFALIFDGIPVEGRIAVRVNTPKPQAKLETPAGQTSELQTA